MRTWPESRQSFVEGFYHERLQESLHYFFPDARLEPLEPGKPHTGLRAVEDQDESGFEFEWREAGYLFTKPKGGITRFERALLASIAKVLAVRSELLAGGTPTAETFHLFRGLPEDRFVSAFLETLAAAGERPPDHRPDRITEAIEVLRASALGTYENRRIAMGALLFGSRPDPCHEFPPLPAGAVRYARDLTAIRSFRRLSDGLQTVALVNTDGLLVEIVDVRHWARPFADEPLPIPCATPFQAHARATLCGGHLCLVLTPNGEIKVFAEGVQVFSFLDGRWRLTDPVEKYRVWANAIARPALAKRLFSVALNLAEERRGALLVLVDDPSRVEQLVPSEDLLGASPLVADATVPFGFKNQLHYLFQHKQVLELAPTVLETLARIDGAIVVDHAATLLAFGSIVRPLLTSEGNGNSVEGGRSTAALAASHYGKALKVSEDGVVAFYQGGKCVWEM